MLPALSSGRSFHIDYSKAPRAQDLLAFDLSILSAEATVNLKPKQAAGGKALGYLSLVEIRPGSRAEKLASDAAVPLLGENAEWGTKLADIASPAWEKVVVEQLATFIASKGFDGFFLDTADSVALLAREVPERREEFQKALVALVSKLDEKFPDKEIIINRGFDAVAQLGKKIDGVLIESIYQSFDPRSGKYITTDPATTTALVSWISTLRKAGLPIYAVDYVAPADRKTARETAAKLDKLGASALVTTPDLDGVTLAPIRRELRKILVLYGWDESEKRPMWAIDTMTAERLQMPLEWMGYECEYLHVGKQTPRASVAGHYAGVIFDAELEFPFGKELWYADWTVTQRQQGVKMLFAGQFPFATDDGMKVVAEGLDLRGTCQTIDQPDSVEIVSVDDSVMNFEAEVRAHRQNFLDLRAPDDSAAMLRLRSKVSGRSIADFEPVFTSSWGGVLLEPYATFMASPSHTLSLFDPFAFLAKIWPVGDFPAPDPTTRAGRRVLVSHIDGDGFASLSETKRGKLCAEVVRDRILKVFPIPVTVSIVESNVRACEKVLDPAKRPFYEEVARSMFELPNVQVGSHTYSHPYLWMANDPDYMNLYETPRLVLHDTEDYGEIDYNREIKGSIDYIEEHLSPPGKKVEILLWSGNCRPPAAALKIVRELGIENMNGGDTLIAGRTKCLSAVAPRTMPWGGELQIFAPNQNEYVYTQNWRGPFFGGFGSVIETFKLTESPRRVKPVNIYYHFYSAANLGALRALERVHQWAMTRPLHAMTAAKFAAMTRDSRQTQFYHNGGRNWTVVNEGHLTTLRIPASLGLPMIKECEGVLGYAEDGSEVYIHTDGRSKVGLVLDTVRPAPQYLRLVESSAEIEFSTLTSNAAAFVVGGVANVSVTLGGVAADSRWEITVGADAAKAVSANKDGRIIFEVPNNSKVSVEQQSIPQK